MDKDATENPEASPGSAPLDGGVRPCPFCGSADVLLTHDAARWPVVQCQDCGANGPSIKLSQDEAVAQWNARPGVAAERESIKARLLNMDDAAAGRHNYYAHAAWVLFERA
jgi:Lar family restriction alleviation protein